VYDFREMGKLRFLTHAALIMRAGYRDANYYFGARILMAAIGFVSVAALTGLKNPRCSSASPDGDLFFRASF